MLTVKLALRNLLRQKRRTLFTGLSMFIGFVLAGFLIGWADGTYNHIIDKFTRNRLGHIQIHQKDYLDKPTLYKTIEDPEEIGGRLDQIGEIEAWTMRIYSAGLVSVTQKSAGADIIGIDLKREEKTTAFSQKVIKGRYPEESGEVLIGYELANILHGGPGDQIAVFSQAADGSIAENLYTIAGLVDMGDPVLNRSGFYMSLKDAQELFVLYNQAHEIAVNLYDLRKTEAVTADIQRILTDTTLSVSPWQEFAEEFYRAMQADKNGMYISLVVVILVVAITILNTTLMSVMERQREYGVLKAIGTRPGGIVTMVIAETSMLAFLSIIVGALVTFGLNLYMAEYGLHLKEPINWGGMQLVYMKSEINFRSFILPAVTVMATSLCVCLFPALKAPRTEPAKTMRIM
ncbi:MAG: FtsX-like permease family protein [Spirochaetales bacterium]|jgi:putative ABC transport system permease protein|nr:FtsX-like permease family protein [Spirochaetales bacterium]